MKRIAIVVALGFLCMGSAAAAQEVDVSEPTVTRRTEGQGWSTLTGDTIGAGAMVVDAGIGWPGVMARLLYGLSDTMDVGGRLTFNYGFEGVVTGALGPGLKLQGMLRLSFLETERVNAALEVGFGPMFYFYRFSTTVGLAIPVGVSVGLPISSAASLAVLLDVPVSVTFGPSSQFALPILLGIGVEYFIDQRLAAQVAFKMGPTLNVSRSAPLTLIAHVGIAYRL